MEHIFHEKQVGQLCAQHCLNALLQERKFTAMDLAEVARNLDDMERSFMREAGESDDYRRFVTEPSGNVDDSGYFSIQVIEKALEVYDLSLVPFKASNARAEAARRQPAGERAYICNYHDHWYTLRKIGLQWFNLNSTLSGPDLISDTYLEIFLQQITDEGHSIFIVVGNLPDCEADAFLVLNPATPRISIPSTRTRQVPVEDEDLKKALALSLENDLDEETQIAIALSKFVSAQGTSATYQVPDEDEELRRALALSRAHSGIAEETEIPVAPSMCDGVSVSTPNPTPVASSSSEQEEPIVKPQPEQKPTSAEELRRLRASFLDNLCQPSASHENQS
ncbi:unnamed protein product [Notodromas monacha]|uniref:Ataxin-3 homolog n=1 Tax=Notodromas monacha TaxID=399045 RepID=A0A7R9BQ22_9CRUS|nr:unnamed protein product [Notodromas monacha]CAG0919543.1 unnamed protein product [Notodromas monacha]